MRKTTISWIPTLTFTTNWLTKAAHGLAVLSVLFLFSCDNDELLSLDFNPEDENINLSYTELTLPFQLVQLDSVSTTNASRILVGNYQSDEFGEVQSTGYVNIGLSSGSAAESNDELDSIVLVLFRNYFYGDTEADLEQTIEIRQLSETFGDTTNYFASSSLPYDRVRPPLGTVTFIASPLEADTLRFPLSDAIGNELLSRLKSNAAEFDSSALFQEYFKGLALVPTSGNSFMTGFSGVRMQMYYSAPTDTASKVYNFSPVRSFNGADTDRSATVLAEIDLPNEAITPADNQFYSQSYTGLIPRIDLQPLEDFVTNSPDRILLSRATLHIGLPEPKDGKAPPSALFGYLVQNDGVSRILSSFVNQQRSLFFYGIYDDSEYFYDQLGKQPVPREATPIIYDSASMSYNLRVTSFSQTLLDGFVDNSQVLLYPNDLNSSVTQIVTSADSVRLKIYYTRLR